MKRRSPIYLCGAVAPVSAAASLLASIGLTAAVDHPDLKGRILGPGQEPIGGAHIFIYTAKPKDGPAYLCPSCYADCGKQTVSGPDGSFSVESLDPGLLFQILVVKDGYLSQFLADIEPGAQPVRVDLETLEASEVPRHRRLRGRVANSDGTPVVGASVSVQGWSLAAGGTTWGPPDRVMLTPLAISDLKGEFALFAKEDLSFVDLEILCRDYAQAEFYEVPLDGPSREYVVLEGGSIGGRLMHQGKPLAGRTVSLSSENRSVRSNFVRQSIDADPDGRFLFYNLPTGLVFNVTASMASIRELGITPLRSVADLQNKEMRDIGDLGIEPGLTVGGRIQLTDGGTIPADSVIFLSHDKIWDGQNKILGPDGAFEFIGFHPGKIESTIRMPGYRLSSLNRSYSGLNGGELLATLTKSTTGLVIELEPGDRDINGAGHIRGIPWSDSVQFRPLHGIEPIPDSQLAARIRVRVETAETGRSLYSYQVTPGWRFEPYPPHPVWNTHQQRIFHSTEPGWVEIDKLSGTAFVQVTADGFLPWSIQVEGKFDETITAILRSGDPVRGLIRQPDGAPAARAQVLMLDPRDPLGARSISFDRGAFWQMGGSHPMVEADANGAFQFAPVEEVGALMIAHLTGFGVIEKPAAGEDLTVRLEAWGTISGRVAKSGDPGLMVQVTPTPPRIAGPESRRTAIHFARLFGDKSQDSKPVEPLLPNIGSLITPGRDGKFRIERLPPGHWWISLSKRETSQGVPGGGFTLRPVATAEVDLKPGTAEEVTLSEP